MFINAISLHRMVLRGLFLFKFEGQIVIKSVTQFQNQISKTQ